MPTRPLERMLLYLHKTARFSDLHYRTDSQLLDDFLLGRDEVAFEALLRRYGPMVLGVCRRVLGNQADADDAFQATFLVLLRKAKTLAARERLGNWLHGVAYRTALRARSRQMLRQQKEQQAERPMFVEPAGECDVRSLLDEELRRLPRKYRLPIVLCHLEGRSRRHVAQQLRLPEGTLSSRLAAGRKLLATRLARRGYGVAGATLVAALGDNSARAAVTSGLIRETKQIATLVASGKVTFAGCISAPVAALTEGVVKAMFWTKLKVVAAAVLAVSVVSTGAFLGGRSALGQAAAPRQAAQSDEQEAQARRKAVGPEINGVRVDFGFMLLNSVEYQLPIKANDHLYAVTFVDGGTVLLGGLKAKAATDARSKREQEIEAKLKAIINVDFKETPLNQVVADIRTWHGLNIVLDRPALADEGIAETRPITMRLTNVSLRTALNLLTHDARLTYMIRDEIIVITTEQTARGKVLTKIYTVSDLVGVTGRLIDNTSVDCLVKLIQNAIAPQTWTEMGGNGSIDFYPRGINLVIKQTPDIHEQITCLLEGMRELKKKTEAAASKAGEP